MKKVKRMMFGGVSKAAGNAAKNAAAKAPTPPPMQKAAMDKMLAGLPKGSTVAGPGTGLAPKPIRPTPGSGTQTRPTPGSGTQTRPTPAPAPTGLGRNDGPVGQPPTRPAGLRTVGDRIVDVTGKTIGAIGPRPPQSTVAGSSVGKSPLDSLKNLPKMSGPLGKVGTTGGQNLPKGMMGLGAALGKNPGINTTTTADMTRQSNAKPFSSIAGSLGMLGGGGASRLLTGNPVTKTVRPFGMKEGGKVSSASSRADGCATKGKTKGKMV